MVGERVVFNLELHHCPEPIQPGQYCQIVAEGCRLPSGTFDIVTPLIEYQLRGQDANGDDTGELVQFFSMEEAWDEFMTGKYWKMSWTSASGRRFRLLKDNNIIEITDPFCLEGVVNDALTNE